MLISVLIALKVCLVFCFFLLFYNVVEDSEEREKLIDNEDDIDETYHFQFWYIAKFISFHKNLFFSYPLFPDVYNLFSL